MLQSLPKIFYKLKNENLEMKQKFCSNHQVTGRFIFILKRAIPSGASDNEPL